ncbi:ParB/RepB/Spo0J family partition protein [Anaerolineae bacterium CFX7]|nr:ParB/RepB/Spo0J family partition protein [Anaerolineae bacterium CFX7]
MKVLLSQIVVRQDDLPDEWLGAPEFTASIQERGVQQPIQVVRLPDAPRGKQKKNLPRHLLIHGRHRWWAAKQARQKEIDVEIVKLDPTNRRQHLEFALVSNEVQTDVDAVTRGKRYQQLIDEGATVEEIAALTKKSIAFIYQHLDMLKLNPPIQQAIQWGRVLFSQARELLRLGADAQTEAWNELVSRAQARNGEIKDVPLNEVRNVVRAFKALDAAHNKHDGNRNGFHRENANTVGDDWSRMYQNYLRANSLATQQAEDKNHADAIDPVAMLEEIAQELMTLSDESDERSGESHTRKLARKLYSTIAQIEPLLCQAQFKTIASNGNGRRQ